MARTTRTTTDRDEIRHWAEAHGGRPTAVKGTGTGKSTGKSTRIDGDPGILRIDFPGFSGERSLRPITWEEFFRWFDANELALVYREDDRFNKLIGRETAAARRRGERTSRRAGRAGMSPQRRAAETRKAVAARRARTTKRPPRGGTATAAPAKARAKARAKKRTPLARPAKAGRRGR